MIPAKLLYLNVVARPIAGVLSSMSVTHTVMLPRVSLLVWCSLGRLKVSGELSSILRYRVGVRRRAVSYLVVMTVYLGGVIAAQQH